jgi:hypothetical protein
MKKADNQLALWIYRYGLIATFGGVALFVLGLNLAGGNGRGNLPWSSDLETIAIVIFGSGLGLGLLSEYIWPPK